MDKGAKMREYTKQNDGVVTNHAEFENRIVDFPEPRGQRSLLSDTLKMMIRARYERVEKAYNAELKRESVNSAA